MTVVWFNLKAQVSMIPNNAFSNGKATQSFRFGVRGTNTLLLACNIQSMELATK